MNLRFVTFVHCATFIFVPGESAASQYLMTFAPCRDAVLGEQIQ
jgi:hypothetical protein